jgi:hypothetical protein
MKKYEGRVVGILGTVIVYLVAGIIFMSFKLGSLEKKITDEFTVEFIQVDEPEDEQKLIRLPSTEIERILQGDEEMLNIARNLANRPDVKVDAADYIDMVKNELIRDGKLGDDNYIDEQKRISEPEGDENLAMKEEADQHEEKDPTESQKMAANYQGPTRIYYELAGRTHTYLPIPIYKCQGSGIIVLAIQVNPKGIVEEAKVIGNKSTSDDICLVEAAVSAALISRFNADLKAQKLQSGTLTYHFVAQ